MEAFIQNPILTFYAPFAWEQPSLTEKQDEYLKSHYVSYPYGQTTTIAQIQTNTIETSALSANINLSPTLLTPLTPLYTPENLTLNPVQSTTYSVNPIGTIGYIQGFKTGTTFTAGTNVGIIDNLTLLSGVYFVIGETSTNWAGGVPTSFFSLGLKITPINNTFVGSFASKRAICLISGQDTPVVIYGTVFLTATTTISMICETDNLGFARKNTYMQAVRIA
jgi:hypothetical protein